MTSSINSIADSEQIRIAADEIRNRLLGSGHLQNLQNRKKNIGVVLGSGLGGAAARLLEQGGVEVPYAAVPFMPATGVVGHSGRLVIGEISDVAVVFLQGRVHTYEGWNSHEVTFGTRLLAELGIHHLILTNAAGGINSAYRPGDLMLIEGHFSLFQPGTLPMPSLSTRMSLGREPRQPGYSTGSHTSPLAGPRAGRDDQVWNAAWIQRARKISTPLRVHQGVYAMMPGPCYETPAEIRMLQRLGADAVGMSTIPEALAAARNGMQVLGVSCITNVAAGLSDQLLDHAEVTATANQIAVAFEDWLWEVISCSQSST